MNLLSLSLLSLPFLSSSFFHTHTFSLSPSLFFDCFSLPTFELSAFPTVTNSTSTPSASDVPKLSSSLSLWVRFFSSSLSSPPHSFLILIPLSLSLPSSIPSFFSFFLSLSLSLSFSFLSSFLSPSLPPSLPRS